MDWLLRNTDTLLIVTGAVLCLLVGFIAGLFTGWCARDEKSPNPFDTIHENYYQATLRRRSTDAEEVASLVARREGRQKVPSPGESRTTAHR
jgi:hypothetical protein